MKNKLSDADAVLLARILTAAAKSGLPFSDAHRNAAIEALMTGRLPGTFVVLSRPGSAILEIGTNRVLCGFNRTIHWATPGMAEKFHETLDTYAPITNETEV